jgi:hypothetical protein
MKRTALLLLPMVGIVYGASSFTVSNVGADT